MAIFKETFNKASTFLHQSLRTGVSSVQEASSQKLKKAPSYALSFGAMIHVGLLSFFGAVALMGGALGGPVLAVAFMALFLSVAYEGEIYVQNIKGSFNKLFKANYLEQALAKKCLVDDFKFTSGNECPAFFRKYDKLNLELKSFRHKKLDADSQKRKKRVEKQLSDMEKWFAIQLFAQDEGATAYQKKVRRWISTVHVGQTLSLRQKWTAIKTSHTIKLTAAKLFGSLDAVFMGIGTGYLLVGLFMAVPFFAALPIAIWPMFIIPLAVFAGVAHGHLVHNAVTDTIVKDIVARWITKIKAYHAEGKTTRAVVIVLGLSAFFVLTVMLSVCTFGTWRTIARTTPALFASMQRVPGVIMSVLNPLVASISVFLFNIENISETSEQLDEASKNMPSVSTLIHDFFSDKLSSIKKSLITLRQQENLLQIINPFRLITSLYTPLRYALFSGHIASMSLMGDQMKHVPKKVAITVGGSNEVAEDLHYFADLSVTSSTQDPETLRRERLENEHDDEVGTDIPTQILDLIFWPLHRLAAGWDCLFSQLNRQENLRLRYGKALDKQLNKEQEVTVDFTPQDELEEQSIPEEGTWYNEHIEYLLQKRMDKESKRFAVDKKIQQDKVESLSQLKETLSASCDVKTASTNIKQAQMNSAYHKLGFFECGQTAASRFLNQLPSRVEPILSM